jgi:hypothetical protein
LPVDPGTIRRVEFQWNGVWLPLANGISGRNYNAVKTPRTTSRADPSSAGSSTAQPIRGVADPRDRTTAPSASGGTQALTKMVKDSDRRVLDDRLIVLFAAANLAPKEQYQRKLAEANSFYRALKKRYRNPHARHHLGRSARPGAPAASRRATCAWPKQTGAAR